MNRLAAALLLCAVPLMAAATEIMFPVPKGAKGVSHVQLGPDGGEQDYFWLDESYPSTSAIDHYSRLFAKWRPCQLPEKEWSAFGDASSDSPRFIHQLVRQWVSRSNDVAVTVLLRYSSPGLREHIVPDSNRQFVAVIRHRMPNAAQELAKTGAKCE